MVETSSTSTDDAAGVRAAEQARLRKERREAKIRAGGTARLNRITGLGGGVQRDPPPSTSPSPPPVKITQPAPEQKQHTEHGDPEEVDISQHYFRPHTASRSQGPGLSALPPYQPSGTTDATEAQLRQMMLGFDRPDAVGPDIGSSAGLDGDPMMNLIKQMMANGPGGPGVGGPGSSGVPFPGLNPFSPPQEQQQQGAAATIPDRYSALWRLLHTIVALGLGLYIAVWTSFSGTKFERDRRSSGGASGPGGAVEEDGPDPRFFFWVFATAETVLLTTRFFLDRTRAAPRGLLWSVVSFLPPPLKGYLEIGMQYVQIFGTVKSDVLVCIFVLGACSWLRST